MLTHVFLTITHVPHIILGCTWVDLVVMRWSHVDFSPVAPSRGDHRIPTMLTHVFLTITHVPHIILGCTWVDLVVMRWSHVDFSPVAPSRGDHRIPTMLTHVFLTITHVLHIYIYQDALGWIWWLCGGHMWISVLKHRLVVTTAFLPC